MARAAAAGLSVRAGFELEFFVSRAGDEPAAAQQGPAYGPIALLQVDEFAAAVLRDLAANGVPVGQFHAEYGLSQLEVSLGQADPVTAADRQLLARQTIHAAARAHGLRVSFAPLVTLDGVGNGLHLHVSVSRGGDNLLADRCGGLPDGDGARFLGGLLRDLPAIAAVSAPSVPSLLRRRPGYFAGVYQFWGVENREAPLRYVPSSPFIGTDRANVELKASDASGNPYLALAAVLAAGLAGIDDDAELPPPIQENPGTWSDAQRAERGLVPLPVTPRGAGTGAARQQADRRRPRRAAARRVHRRPPGRRGLGGRPLSRRRRSPPTAGGTDASASVADRLAQQQHGAAPGMRLGVEDQHPVDGARPPVDDLDAGALQRQDVILDPAQRGAQVGDDLLRADDPDRVGGAAGVAGQLAAAGRGDHQRAGLGDGVDAADRDVGAGEQPPDLVGVLGPVQRSSRAPGPTRTGRWR